MTPDLQPYVVLLSSLVAGRLAPTEFQAVFVALFKSDQLWRPGEVYEILNEMFLTTEAYGPEIASSPYRVTEHELCEAAATTIRRIHEVVNTG